MLRWRRWALVPSFIASLIVFRRRRITVVGAIWGIHSSTNITGDGAFLVGGFFCYDSGFEFLGNSNISCLAVSDKVTRPFAEICYQNFSPFFHFLLVLVVESVVPSVPALLLLKIPGVSLITCRSMSCWDKFARCAILIRILSFRSCHVRTMC